MEISATRKAHIEARDAARLAAKLAISTEEREWWTARASEWSNALATMTHPDR